MSPPTVPPSPPPPSPGRARKPRSLGRRIARILGKTVLGVFIALILVVAAAEMAFLVVTRTEWGHRHLLAFAVPRIEQKLTGKLRIGRLEGDLLHALVLDDVEVDDADLRPAIRVRRLEVDWNPLGLLHHTISLSHVGVDGLDVVAQPLRDGRFNLGALVKPSAPSTDTGPPAWKVSLADVRVLGRGSYRDGGALRAAGFVSLAGKLDVAGGATHAALDKLLVLTTAPAAAQLDGKVRIALAPGLQVERGDLALRTTGAQIARLAPSTKVSGPVALDLHAAGALESLALHAELRPARGVLDVDGRVGVRADGVHWQGQGKLRGMDPDLWRGVPHGLVEADFGGEGIGGKGRVSLPFLDARTMGVTLAARGDGTLDGEVRAELHVDAPDLGKVRALPGHPSGSLRAVAHVDRHAGKLLVDARADGRRLAMGTLHARALRLDAHAVDLAGRVTLDVRDLLAGGRNIDRVHLALRGDGRAVATAIDVQGVVLPSARPAAPGMPATPPRKMSAQLGAHARIVRRQGQLAGVVGQVDRLALALARSSYRLEEPARFEVDRGGVHVVKLHMDGPEAHLLVAGTYRTRGFVDAHLELRHVEVEDAVALYDTDLSRRIPETDLDLVVDAKGATSNPLVTGHLSAGIAELAGLTSRFHVGGNFRWAERHASAELTGAAIEGGKVLLRADGPLPFRRAEKVHAHLELSDVLAQTIAAFVPALAGTQGKLTGQLDANGTIDKPVVTVSLMADGITRGKVKDVDLTLSLAYVDQLVKLGVGARLGSGQELAAVTADMKLSGDSLTAAVADLQHADAALEAQLLVRKLDLQLLKGVAPQIEGVKGELHAKVDVSGTLRKPTVAAALDVGGLALGKVTFDRSEVKAGWDGAVATLSLVLDQKGGGKLHAGARVAGLAPDAPLAATVEAHGFDLALAAPFVSSGVSDPSGLLDASVRVGGTRAAPSPSGTIDLTKGSFVLLAEARRYKDVTVSVAATPAQVTLKNLAASTNDGGHVVGHGSLALKDARPEKLEAELDADHFAISAGGAAVGTLDGRIRVHGASQKDGFDGTVVVDNSSVALPRMASKKKLQSTGALQDVVLVDEKQKVSGRTGGGMNLDFKIHIPGPFLIHGPEVSTELSGDLDVAVRSGEVAISGTVGTTSGWIDVLGHRFSIDHARVAFDGAERPDPALDIRVTRQRADALLWVDVSGTASAPHVNFGSEPARFSESEILAMLISDDPQAGVQDTSLSDKVVGAISGVIVGKLKDQLAPSLPIDVLKIDVGGQQGVASTRIEVGKYLTPKIYISYVHQFGTQQGLQPRNSNQATVEWRFARHTELDTTFGDAGVGSADIFWTWRF